MSGNNPLPVAPSPAPTPSPVPVWQGRSPCRPSSSLPPAASPPSSPSPSSPSPSSSSPPPPPPTPLPPPPPTPSPSPTTSRPPPPPTAPSSTSPFLPPPASPPTRPPTTLHLDATLTPAEGPQPALTVHLHSGDGWYSAETPYPPTFPLRLPLSAFTPEGHPGPAARATEVRLSLWNRGPASGTLAIRSATLVPPAPIAILRSTDETARDEAGFADAMARRLSATLARADLPHDIIPDTDLSEDALSRYPLLFLPYAPTLTLPAPRPPPPSPTSSRPSPPPSAAPTPTSSSPPPSTPPPRPPPPATKTGPAGFPRTSSTTSPR